MNKAALLAGVLSGVLALAAGAARTERLGALKLVGVASGLAGLCVILNPTSLDWSNLHVIAGAGMIILAAILMTAGAIWLAKTVKVEV